MGEPIDIPELADWIAEQHSAKTPHHSLNGYLCDTCRVPTMTIDVHVGVAPFTLRCRATPGCAGLGRSAMYPAQVPPVIYGEPKFEWARPSREDFELLDDEVKDHVMRGGLVLRARTDLPGAYVVEKS